MKHLLFYDGKCGLCDQVVQFVLKHDKEKIFVFAPLQGETAAKWLNPRPPEDTALLIENFEQDPHIYMLSQATLRTLWLLGGLLAIPGVLFFLPTFFFDWGYRLIAKYRKSFFPYDKCVLPSPTDKKRFLP